MKIGILGSGKVAKTLGSAWAVKGHEVTVGARNPQSAETREWQQAQPQTVQIRTPKEAAAFGEVILVAINPWTEIENVLSSLTEELHGKTILDVSNNIIFDGQPKLAFTDKSMGEFIQSLLPESFVVKTLNITPAPMMVEPEKSGIIPSVGWVSGNDAAAKSKATNLLKELGWTEVADLGDIHQSLLQENVGLVLSLVVSSLRTA